MSSLAIKYAHELHHHFRTLHAAWPVTGRFSLGDFGYLTDGLFQRKSHLRTVGVSFRTRINPNPPAHYAYTSGKVVEVGGGTNVGGSAGAGMQVKGEMTVNFCRENAVLFSAAGCVVREIEDQIGLGKDILRLFASRQWNDDWFVVTSLVEAASATVVVSECANAQIVLNSAVSDGQVDLANADTRLIVHRKEGIGFAAIAERSTTPLLGLSHVRRKWFGGSPSFDMRGDEERDELQFRNDVIERGEEIERYFSFAEAANGN